MKNKALEWLESQKEYIKFMLDIDEEDFENSEEFKTSIEELKIVNFIIKRLGD